METNKDQPTDAGTNGQTASASPGSESRPRGRVIGLPSLPALPGLRQLSWLRPQVKLPSREKMLLYAGLGTMAAIELIDWPVAAAIAMATILTSSGSRSESLPEVSLRRDEPPARPAPSAAPKTAARRPRATE